MKQLILCLIGLFWSTLSFSQTQLSGQITDEADDALVGATVYLREKNQIAIADENGFYKIGSLNPGVYSLRFSYVGYENTWETIEILPNQDKVTFNPRLTEKIISLDNISVVATRAGSQTPFTYSTVDEEEIEKRNLGQDVPFMLRWTPSTVVTSDAGAGIGYTYMRVRGTDGSRTNVTINGIPLNDAESQGVFWVNMPDFITSTNDVQIQRGVGSSTNGAGAFGASINMNTNKIKEEAYGEVNLSGGSFNTRRANVQFGTGLINDKFTFDGRLSKIESDGYIDRASSDLESFFASAAYFSEKSSLRLNVFSGSEVTYQAWNGVPSDFRNIRQSDDGFDRTFNDAGTDFGAKAGEPYDNEVDDYQQTHVQLHYNTMFNRNWNLTLAGHYTAGAGFFEQYKADEPLAGYLLPNILAEDNSTVLFNSTDLVRRRWLDNDYFGGTWSLNYLADNNRLQATFGGAAHQYNGDHFGDVVWAERLPENTDPTHRYYFGTGDKFDFNVFGKANYQLTNRLNGYLDLQFRTIDYVITGTDNDLRDVSTEDNLNFFNPKIGLFYDLDANKKLYASFGRISREPARGDYTDAPQGVMPEPETLNNIEAGMKWNSKKAAFNVNVYYMGYEDQLIPTGALNDVGSPIRVNVPNSYRAGIELAGGVSILPRLRFDGTATFSQNKIEAFTEFADAFEANGAYYQEVIRHEDTDIAYSPSVITTGELTYDLMPNNTEQDLAVSLLGKYVSEQFVDNTSNDNAKLDAYFFSDLRLNYSLKTKFIKEINFTFLVQNVFDELYENNGWVYRSYGNGGTEESNFVGVYPQATRNFLVGLGFKF